MDVVTMEHIFTSISLRIISDFERAVAVERARARSAGGRSEGLAEMRVGMLACVMIAGCAVVY